MVETSPPKRRYQSGERVALFLPCYCDALFPQVGVATVKLFARLGIPLDYPTQQTCCGQPAFNTGHWSEARELAVRFAHIFASYEDCGALRVLWGYGSLLICLRRRPTAGVGSRVSRL
jgi:Fe-S oxidoreductase